MTNVPKSKKSKTPITFPARLVSPIRDYLKLQLKNLRTRRRSVKKEDPFSDPGRATDNAAIDTDAAEQFGHDRATAIGTQLDRKIIQTKKALAAIKIGKYGICTDCGMMIDTDRLSIYPEATVCVKCESKREKK